MRIFRWFATLLVLAGLALGGMPDARATVLAVIAEDGSANCVTGGSCTTTTASGNYRAGWARAAYQVTATASDPPTNRIQTAVFTASSTIWIHAQFCDWTGAGCGNSTTSNYQLIRILDSSGNPALVVRGTGTAGQVKISSRTSGGTFTDLVTCSSVIGAGLTQIDLNVVYGASGSLQLNSNGSSVCTYSGNTTNGDGATTLNQIEFSDIFANEYGVWSEIIVATTDTDSMGVLTMYTNSNGNATNWSGANVCSSIWNAASASSSTYAYTASNNVLHNCGLYNTIPSGNWSVQAVASSFQGLVGGTGPQHLEIDTHVAGTDYFGASIAPTNGFANYQQIQATNPATGVAWTTSDLTASTLYFGLESLP